MYCIDGCYFFTDYSATPLNKLVGYVIVPFQNGVSRIGTWLSVRVDELGELRIVLEENQKLKEKVDELTAQNTQPSRINMSLIIFESCTSLMSSIADMKK